MGGYWSPGRGTVFSKMEKMVFRKKVVSFPPRFEMFENKITLAGKITQTDKPLFGLSFLPMTI